MFQVEFHQYRDESGCCACTLRHSRQELGRPLVEPGHVTAGYRFLPVFYLAHAAYLDWSPHTEQMLPGVFRPRSEAMAGVPDGEGPEAMIALFTLQYSERFADEEWAELLDPDLVRAVSQMSADIGLPFGEDDWARALAGGMATWRDLRTGKGKDVLVDPARARLEVIAH